MACACLLLYLAGCTGRRSGVQPFLDDHYPEKLSEWQLFKGDQRELKPDDRVVVYEVNTPLFSDYATKLRTVWMPAGVSAKYSETGVFNLPAGSILTKSFSFEDRHIETRLYIHKANGWAGITYVWKHDQSDAILDVTPEPVLVTYKGKQFDYTIPNVNQCKTCHEGPSDNGPLGLTARNLNRDDQLAQWTRIGYLSGAPAQLPQPDTTLNGRARAYLDVNCGTCHVVGGRGMKSGVFLTAAEGVDKNLGICKAATDVPASFDIVPGQPDRSMLLHRMRSLDRKIMMPDIGHDVVHQEGIELIRDWIASLHGSCPAGKRKMSL